MILMVIFRLQNVLREVEPWNAARREIKKPTRRSNLAWIGRGMPFDMTKENRRRQPRVQRSRRGHLIHFLSWEKTG
jgi:hypothetical protein